MVMYNGDPYKFRKETMEERAGRIKAIVEAAYRKTEQGEKKLESMQAGMVDKLTANYDLQQKQDDLLGEHLQSLQEKFEAIGQETEEAYNTAYEAIDELNSGICGVELDDVGGDPRQSLERMYRES